MKRITGIANSYTGKVVTISPPLESDLRAPNGESQIADAFDKAFKALAEVGIEPWRIVHGTPEDVPDSERTRQEIVLAARGAERRKICAELTQEAEFQLSKHREGVGLALYMAAWKIAKSGERL